MSPSSTASDRPVVALVPEDGAGADPPDRGPASPVWDWAASLGVGGAIELVASLVLVAVAVVELAKAISAAASESLWTDEIYSIAHYSARGPWTTLTTYDVANNHIFFNLLNSLTPGAGSYDPLHARIWSIVAVLAAIGLGAEELYRRRWYLAGGLYVFALGANHDLLDLVLQARGYGILLLCSTVASVAAWHFLESKRRRWLLALALATLVGSWTVPTFIFLAAAVWLGLLLVDRSAKVLRYGLGSAAVTVVVYLPVQAQLRSQLGTYAKLYGRQYDQVGDLEVTLRTYLPFHNFTFTVMAVFVALAALAAVIAPRRLGVDRAAVSTAGVLVGASVLFLAACRVLSTPALRTTSFVVVPVLLGLLVPASALLDGADFDVIRPTAALTAAVILLPTTITYIDHQPYVPVEQWLGAATYVNRTFPDHTPVYDQRAPQNVAIYLSRGNHVLPPDPVPVDQIRAGHAVVVDLQTTFTPTAGESQVLALPNLVEQDLANQRGHGPPHAIRVLFAVPGTSHVATATVDGRPAPQLLDHELATTTSAHGGATTVVVTPDGGSLRALLLSTSTRLSTHGVVVEVVTASGARQRLATDHLQLGARLLTVWLGDQPLRSIQLTLVPARGKALALAETWLYQP